MTSVDHQKIHPVPNIEAPPPLPQPPLVSPRSYPSDTTKSDCEHLPSTKRGHSCCCRLCCYITCLILLFIIALGATVGILFLIFHPKIPKYTIPSLRITRFSPDPASDSLPASFSVNITSNNPNTRIGIFYLGGSHLSAWYRNTLLCEGQLPVFYQGHRNITIINIPLTGTVYNATSMVATLQQDQTQRGIIPLVLTAKVPINIKMGKLKLMKMRFNVHCDLIINNLTVKKDIRITSSDCKFKLGRLF